MERDHGGRVSTGLGRPLPLPEPATSNSADIQAFRKFFDLPMDKAANTPIRISGTKKELLTVCTDTTGLVPYPSAPCTIDDLIENSLDVEWLGVIAKNAQIVLVASYPSSATDDNLYDSESYIVDNLTARIMNVSYGLCELYNGTASNVEYYNLWQTAYAEGIAVFVASGRLRLAQLRPGRGCQRSAVCRPVRALGKRPCLNSRKGTTLQQTPGFPAPRLPAHPRCRGENFVGSA